MSANRPPATLFKGTKESAASLIIVSIVLKPWKATLARFDLSSALEESMRMSEYMLVVGSSRSMAMVGTENSIGWTDTRCVAEGSVLGPTVLPGKRFGESTVEDRLADEIGPELRSAMSSVREGVRLLGPNCNVSSAILSISDGG
jgi:hypothetical protein